MADNGNPTPPLRRSARRGALTEINDDVSGESTPKKGTSPDEVVILQRGPRRKPLTWSPYEYNKAKIFGPSRETTPEPTSSDKKRGKGHKPDINSKLRRRLVMTPEKNQGAIGESIAQRILRLNKTRNSK